MDMSNVKSIVDNNVSRLPSEYQEVEYLESSGTQYIDTGVYCNHNMTFSTGIAKVQNINTTWFGSRNSGNYATKNEHLYLNQNTRTITLYTTTADLANADFSLNYITDITPQIGTRYDIRDMTCVETMNDAIYPLFLFGLNNIGTPSLTPTRLYYLIIKENQVTLYHFIPVVRKSDSKPGMYDLVNDVFYTNAGTGEFTYGEEIVVGKNVKKITDANGNILWYKVPDGYRKVEYLESSGTQYIDIQTYIDREFTVKTSIEYKNTINDVSPFGFLMTENSVAGRRFAFFTNSSDLFVGIGSSSSQVSYSQFPSLLNTKRQIIGGEYGFSVDGQDFLANNANIDWKETFTFRLFGRYSNGTYVKTFKGKIYYFIVPRQFHLIPVVRNSDDKPGMYDLVNDVFYTNAGTGEFTYGGGN